MNFRNCICFTRKTNDRLYLLQMIGLALFLAYTVYISVTQFFVGNPYVKYILPVFLMVILGQMLLEKMVENLPKELVWIFHVFFAISVLIYYRELSFAENIDITKEALLKPIEAYVLCVVAVFVGWCIMASKIYKWRYFQIAMMAAGPLMFVIARFFGTPIRGVYNWVGPVMPSEICKISILFFILYIEYEIQREKLYTLLVIMIFTGSIGVCGLLCNEYGTVMLLGLTLIAYFFIKERWRIIGKVLGIGSVIAMLLGYAVSAKIRTRFLIILDYEAAINSVDTYVKNQVAIFERIDSSLCNCGLLGTGFSLSKTKLPPSMSTDYFFAEFLLEFGLPALCVLLVLFLVVFLILLGFRTEEETDSSFQMAAVVLFAVNTVVVVCGALRLLPLCGITPPWVAACSSIQSTMVVYAIVGMLVGLNHAEYDDDFEKNEYKIEKELNVEKKPEAAKSNTEFKDL